MRYLVTGGAGFIGSHLVDQLVDEGHQVVVFDSFSTGRIENMNKKAVCCHRFVQDYRDNPDATLEYDAIFHLAALPRIQPSFRNPFATHDSNVTGTIQVLELAKKNKTPVVFAGSSSVLGDIYANPYSFSKHIGESYCTLYNKLFDVPVAIARFFNVYGPRQIEDGEYATVIGIFEKQKRQNIPLTITGNGEQRRDFTHVKDIVAGLIAMSKDRWNADIFNLGSGVNYSINEIAQMFKSHVEYIPSRPGEAISTLADISYTKEKLGWVPIYNIKDYIEKIVNVQLHGN
jgi:UDP-glucose 4-epimerase